MLAFNGKRTLRPVPQTTQILVMLLGFCDIVIELMKFDQDLHFQPIVYVPLTKSINNGLEVIVHYVVNNESYKKPSSGRSL
jgi:hypothetical protein